MQPDNLMHPDAIIRRDRVEQLCGLKRSTLYAAIARGEFPRPVHLTRKAVGWKMRDVVAWLNARKHSEAK
jgi:prophage regulatory protein